MIPIESDALFLLTGEVTLSGSDYIATDQINGWIFTVEGGDFIPSDIIPFRTSGKIKPPTSGTAKAQIRIYDVDNFWYQSDGTPNEIPIISFYQNINFKNRALCLHVEQTLNANGTENTYAGIKDITLYKNENNISSLAAYFGDEVIPVSGAKFIDPVSGSDAADGSQATPWKTVGYANSQSIDGKTVYIYSGSESLSVLWVDNNTTMWQGVGDFQIDEGSKSYILRVNKPSTYSGIRFKSVVSGNSGVLQYGLATFNKCESTGGFNGTYGFDINETTVFNDCVGSSIRILASHKTVTKNRCKNLVNLFQSGTGFTYSNLYGVHTVEDRLYTNLTSVVIKYSDYTGAAMVQQRVNSITGSVTLLRNTYTANQDNAGLIYPKTLINMTLSYDATYNEVINNGFDNIGILNGGNILPDSIIEFNTFIPDDTATNSFGIALNNNGFSAVHSIKYNTIHKRKGVGSIIGLGNDQTDGSMGDLDGTEIFGNVLYGPDYYGNLNTGSHSMLILNQLGIDIKYNRVYKNQLGIVVKNEHADEQTYTGSVAYNVVNAPLLSRGMQGVKFYLNTIHDSYLHLLETSGTSTKAKNCSVKNNIFLGPGTGTAIRIDDDAEEGLSCDLNLVYDYTNYQNLTTNGTLLEWRALGFGLTSTEGDPELTNPDKDNYVPLSDSFSIGKGENLGTEYEYGLDEDNVFGQETITKQQERVWTLGAYAMASIEGLIFSRGSSFKNLGKKRLNRFK